MTLGIDRLTVRVIEIQDTLKLLTPTVSLMLLTTLGEGCGWVDVELWTDMGPMWGSGIWAGNE